MFRMDWYVTNGLYLIMFLEKNTLIHKNSELQEKSYKTNDKVEESY